MALLALVDYGFIVAFFVGLALLVLIISIPRSQEDTASKKTRSGQRNIPAYSILATLFVLLIVLTFLVRKKRSPLSLS